MLVSLSLACQGVAHNVVEPPRSTVNETSYQQALECSRRRVLPVHPNIAECGSLNVTMRRVKQH